MKKLLPTLAILCLYQFAFSQYCGFSEPSVCTPQGSPTQPGFNVSTPLIIVNGQATSLNIGFQSWINYGASPGDSLAVDSMQILSIGPDPLFGGLCWATNKTNNLFAPGEYGCIVLTGTPCVPTGQYFLQANIGVYAHFTVDGPHNGFEYHTFDVSTYVQVANPGQTAGTPFASQGAFDPYLPNGANANSIPCAGNNLSVFLGPTATVALQSVITLNPATAGGTPPYTYAWNSLGGDSLSCYNCRYPNVTNTKTDTFIVTVTDSLHHTAKDTIVYFGSSTFPCGLGFTNANFQTCNLITDTLTLALTNHLAPGPNTINWGNGIVTSQSGSRPTGGVYTQPGVYLISVYDSYGCLYSALDTVGAMNISIQAQANPTCTGVSTGVLVATASGVPDIMYYGYQWSNGATTATISHVPAGTYTVSVSFGGSDGNNLFGCSAKDSFILSPFADYYTFLQETDANCSNNGTVQATTYGGTLPYAYLWGNSSTTANLTGLSAGNYAVTVTDSAGCQALGNIVVGSACYGIVTGTVYHNVGNSCQADTTQHVGAGLSVEVTSSSGNHYYGYTNANGFYTVLVPDTGVMSIALTAAAGQACSANDCNTGATATIHTPGDSTGGHTLVLPTAFTGFDLAIHPGWATAAPGFIKKYWIYCYNGTLSPYIGPVTVTFVYDSNLVYQYSTGPQPTVNLAAHTLTWNLDTIPVYGNWLQLPCYFLVPSTLSPGYLLQSDFTIDPTAGDCDTTNNHLHFSDLITGSHDPNEKDVEPVGSLSYADSVLTYTIHFQNDGTDSTHFIIVKDTLSQYLNAASVQNIASSAKFNNFTITGNGVLTWTFNPYRLPDSLVDAYGSRGFITFSVNKYGYTPAGAVINNTATISFDYNPPVATNTISNAVISGAPNGIIQVSQNAGTISVLAFPNPFHEFTNIVVSGLSQQFDFELYDVTGRLVKRIPSLNTNEFQIQNGGMATGVYMYRIITGTSLTTGASNVAFGKIVVE